MNPNHNKFKLYNCINNIIKNKPLYKAIALISLLVIGCISFNNLLIPQYHSVKEGGNSLLQSFLAFQNKRKFTSNIKDDEHAAALKIGITNKYEYPYKKQFYYYEDPNELKNDITTSIIPSKNIQDSQDDINFNYKYINYCRYTINRWIQQRKILISTKLKVIEQYKNDLAYKAEMYPEEKEVKENYINYYKNLNYDFTNKQILNLVRNKESNDLIINDYLRKVSDITPESLFEIKLCSLFGEEIITNLYYYWDAYALYDYDISYGESDWSFRKLKSVAQNLELDLNLDFTVLDIITEEAQNIQGIVSYNYEQVIDALQLDHRRHYSIEDNLLPFESLNHKVKKYGYKRYLKKVMPIFEETNKKLGKIDPNNMGFKTAAYKARMKEYMFWKSKLKEVELLERK